MKIMDLKNFLLYGREVVLFFSSRQNLRHTKITQWYLFSEGEDFPLVHTTKLGIHMQVLLVQGLRQWNTCTHESIV